MPSETIPKSAATRAHPTVRTLLLWLILACLFPAVLGVGIIFFHLYQDGRAQLQKTTIQTARAMVQTFDARLFEVQSAAQALSTSPYLATGDFAAFHRQARELLQKTGLGVAVLLSDSSGQELVNTMRPFGLPLPRHGNPGQILRVFASGQPAVSGVFRGRTTGRIVVSIDVPVLSGGKVVYDLGISILADNFSQMLLKQHLAPDWLAGVFDQNGVTAGRTRAPEQFVGTMAVPALLAQLRSAPEGAFETTTREGIPALIFYSCSATSHWSVAIAIPRQSLEAKLRRTVYFLALGTALLFGAGIGLAWFIGGRIARSVRALTVPAIALEAGVMLPAFRVYFREADEVAQAMARTARILTQRTRALVESHTVLQERDTDLSEAQRIAQIGSWRWDAVTDTSTVSEELLRIYARQSVPPFAEQMKAMYLGNTWTQLASLRDGGPHSGAAYDLELPAVRADGMPMWIHTRGEEVCNAGGAVTGLRGTVQDITPRKLAEEKLRHSEERYRAMVEWSPEAIAIFAHGRVLYVNPAAVSLFGAASAQELVGKSIFDFIHPDFHSVVLARVTQLAGHGSMVPMLEEKFIRLDGSFIDVEVQSTPIVYDGQTAIHSSMRDITRRKQAQEAQRWSSMLFANLQDGAILTDRHGKVLAINPAFTAIEGYAEADILGRHIRILRSRRQDAAFYRQMWQTIVTAGNWQGEIWNRHRNGATCLERLSIHAVHDQDGLVANYVSTCADLTRIKHADRMEHLAHHDTLTGLPNRLQLLSRLEHELERSHGVCAVLFLDLDRFKVINDTWGHGAGDDLLQQVAQRLAARMRDTDTLARLGGDEFVALLVNVDGRDSVARIAGEFIALLNQAFMLADGRQASIGASVGIAMFPADAENGATLLRHADAALYQAKEAGRNGYRFHVAQGHSSVN